MFINTFGPIFFDPIIEPTKLIIATNTDNRLDCGVFSYDYGDYLHQLNENKNDFDKNSKRKFETKENPRLKSIKFNAGNFKYPHFGYEAFEIKRPKTAVKNIIVRHCFALVCWNDGVYIQYPKGQELLLEEFGNKSGEDEKYRWVFHGFGIGLVLPDYNPLIKKIKKKTE